MWINTVLFAAGILLCQQLKFLPHFYWSVAVLLLILFVLALALAAKDRAILPLLLFAMGFSWAVVYGHWKLADRIEQELVSQPILLTGSIVELPQHEGQNWRFVFEPESALYQGAPVNMPSRLRLSWYKSEHQPGTAQRWQFLVKLKPPNGLLNPGLFDYESWLFQKDIGARGYIVDSQLNRFLGNSGTLSGFDALRQNIRSSVFSYAEFPAASALVAALTVGDKSRITQKSWNTFRVFGINHLVAISGLHVGMIVMLVYWVSGRIWRLSVRACEWIPAPQAQAITGLAAAFFYAGLAGFTLPTRRALIMIGVLLLARIFLVNMQPFRQLAIAVFIVLLWDPPAIISAGFWLSFMAVTAIFLSLGGKTSVARSSSKPAGNNSLIGKVRELVVMQWSITLMLLPFSLLFFKQVSVVSPLANLLLIPLFSFFVVPVSLLLAFLNEMDFSLVRTVFIQFLGILEWLLVYLDKVAVYDWFVFKTAEISTGHFLLLLVPVFLWHLVRLSYHKPLAVILFVTALMIRPPVKPRDQLFVTVPDVGQGTSVLLETAGKVLLYDLGPRYGNGNSATMSVVVPFLRNKGINKIDKLVISHSDSDHAGDLQGFLDVIDVGEIVTGEILDNLGNYSLCQSGQTWQWQQTDFEFLSPYKHPVKDNNASCVLRVRHGENSLLLTGDIEQRVERQLLKKDRNKLAATVVLVPHHGSKSSSTAEFVKAIDANVVINTSAYLNRYGFPREEVKQRWLKNGAKFLNTGHTGALELKITANAGEISLMTFTDRYAKYWHWPR